MAALARNYRPASVGTAGRFPPESVAGISGIHIRGVLSERDLVVEDNTAEEVFADKGQCKNGFCQRSNTMAVMFAHPAFMHQGRNLETAEKIINFALNINMGL